MPAATRARALVVLVVLLAACAAAPLRAAPEAVAAAAATTPPPSFIVVHTNDRHGYVEGQLDKATGLAFGGMDSEATLLRELRADALRAGLPVIAVDAGDMFQGTPVVNETQGECMVRLLNTLRYQLATFGNHEFDYGQDVLRTRMGESRFRWLSSTVDAPTLRDRYAPYATFEVAGTKVAFVAATSPNTPGISFPGNVRGLTFRDALEALPPLVSRLRRLHGVTVVVLISHLGFDSDEWLARSYDGLDLIVGGHTHTVQPTPVRVRNTWIAQAGSQGRYVGVCRVHLGSGGRVAAVTGELREVDRKRYPPDPAVAAIIEGYTVALQPKLREVVGQCSGTLDRGFTGVDSPMGVVLADAYREAAGAELGLMNVGGVRNSLTTGPVTVGDAFLVAPFGNTVVKMQLTGAMLQRIFERMLSGEMEEIPADKKLELVKKVGAAEVHGLVPSKGKIGYLVGAGVQFRFDSRNPPGRRLLSLELAGGPVEPGRLYSVATNNFLAYGGDGFQEFTEGRGIQDVGVVDAEAIKRYFKKHGTVAPPKVPSALNHSLEVKPKAP